MFLVSSCSCLCPIHCSQVLSREWRCSWSSADRRCPSYIWVINNIIAHWGAAYISGLTVTIPGRFITEKEIYHHKCCPCMFRISCVNLYKQKMSWWAQWRLKSPASRLFTQPFIHVEIKDNIKVPRHWLLWGEFTGGRWIPRTNGQ